MGRIGWKPSLSWIIVLASGFDVLMASGRNHNAYQKQHMAEAVKHAQGSVVTIKAYQSQPKKGFCRVGSGFIYNGDGFIITRGSVVHDGDSIIVAFADGRTSTGWLVYHDSHTEVSIIKTHMDELTPVTLGKSSTLSMESQITVIGNSLGVFPSVTLGTYIGRRSDGMLKLKAMIPAGNSGSPLLDEYGKLVGILAGGILESWSSDASSEKIGIALPVEKLSSVVDAALHRLKKERGWIGISVVNLDTRDSGYGVRVVGLAKEGPAERAGICVGDTILAFQNKPVRYADELANWVMQSRPDNPIQFRIVRNGNEIIRSVHVRIKPWLKGGKHSQGS